MPKLKNVTLDDLTALDNAAADVGQNAFDFADRIEKGYCDNIPDPVARCRAFMSVSRAFGDLAHKLLVKASLQEQKRELEDALRRKKGA